MQQRQQRSDSSWYKTSRLSDSLTDYTDCASGICSAYWQSDQLSEWIETEQPVSADEFKVTPVNY